MRELTFVVAIVLFSATGVVAKDWRGLLPLHSTREDVEKLLGPPPSPSTHPSRSYILSKGRSIYLLDEGEVYIVFAEEQFPAAKPCLLRSSICRIRSRQSQLHLARSDYTIAPFSHQLGLSGTIIAVRSATSANSVAPNEPQEERCC